MDNFVVDQNLALLRAQTSQIALTNVKIHNTVKHAYNKVRVVGYFASLSA